MNLDIYKTLFDLTELPDSKKRYFESMLQSISEVESVQKVFDSLLKRKQNTKKIKVSFSLPKNSIEKGLAHTNSNSPLIELKENEDTNIGSIDFFNQAVYLAHEITHFDNDYKLAEIKDKLNIKQEVISFLFDEIQAESIGKDCQNYFRRKNKIYDSSFRGIYTDKGEEVVYQNQLMNPQKAYLDFLQGSNRHPYTGFYIDRVLTSKAEYPTYGKGMDEEEFYTYLRKNLFKTNFIPLKPTYNWNKENSDKTYWIEGSHAKILFDERNNPIYSFYSKGNTSYSQIFSKKIRNLNGIQRPEFWDKESNSHLYSPEEAKSYQSVCGTCLGIGRPLTSLYFLAISTTIHTKKLIQNSQLKLTQILKKASTEQSQNKGIIHSKISQNSK